MEFLNDITKKVEVFASENASTLLTAAGVVGTVGTAALAFRAGYKYQEVISAEEASRTHEAMANGGEDVQIEPLTNLEKAQLAGLHIIPPVLTGVTTITAIVFANRMSAQKAAALAAAYGLSQRQFDEYKTKVEEKLTGAKKDRPNSDELNAELAQERANRSTGSKAIVLTGADDMLCFDQPTGRYFKSTMEKINRAVNRTNEHIFNNDYASANFFYEELGLPNTTWGDEVGFNRNNILEITVDAILDPDDRERPCLAIDFQKLPTEDFIRRMYE